MDLLTILTIIGTFTAVLTAMVKIFSHRKKEKIILENSHNNKTIGDNSNNNQIIDTLVSVQVADPEESVESVIHITNDGEHWLDFEFNYDSYPEVGFRTIGEITFLLHGPSNWTRKKTRTQDTPDGPINHYGFTCNYAYNDEGNISIKDLIENEKVIVIK